MASHAEVVSTSSEAEPRTGLLALSLVVAAVAVMASSLDGPFIFDDVPLIHGNDRVHGFSHWQRWFQSTLWDTNYDPSEVRHTRGFWRPLVLLSYAVDWRLGGGSPISFHLTNLLLHAINASLLFRVLRGWVDSRLAALLGALLFAVHPVQTEPVAWIAGRTDSLCVLGLLSALLGLRLWRERRVAGALVLCAGLAVAFGSKEAAVVFPVLAGIEVWAARREALTWPTLRALLPRVAPFAGLSIAFFVLHRLFVPATSGTYPLTLAGKVLLPLEALGRYTALLVWPNDLTLGRATIPISDGALVPHRGYAALGVATVVGVLAGAWRLRRANPGVALGLLASGAMVLPVLTIVWLGYDVTASPRFLYVPMTGLTLVVAGLLQTRWGERTRVRAGFLILLVALGGRSFLRSADYSDEHRFWERELASNERYVSMQQYVITRELKLHRPASALQLAHRWYADPLVSVLGKAALVRTAVAAALDLTPDVDTESLTRLLDFAAALAVKRPSDLSLPRLGLELRFPTGSQLLRHMEGDRRQYQLFAANAASRLGDDATAVRYVEAALERCSECWTILTTSALILARAGQLERAEKLLTHTRQVGAPDGGADRALENVQLAAHWRSRGPSDPVLRESGFYSSLGAFGRAYRIAAPAL
ncbi:MAG TPA: hypothetical protein VNN80_12590, partial [Polyangiaceae bacterium]|nr:hypothetical protein [Polyangiaceae bacterium]